MITVEIPDWAEEALRLSAQSRGVTIGSLLRSTVMNAAREWSRPFPQSVADLHATGASTAQIAAALGVTNARVLGALRKLGLSPNPPQRPQAEAVNLSALVRAGLTDAEVSELLNLTVATVAERRRRLDLPANRRYTRSQQ
jgi:DNA-binding NarL/FixJ family response regulator